jgi:hypothetical protein
MNTIPIQEDAPTKLSVAITMALKDMAKVEKSKTMRIEMSDWHSYRPHLVRECSVCMAGAVMHYKAKLDTSDDISGLAYFSREWRRVFNALDAFRLDNVAGALQYLLVDEDECLEADAEITVDTDYVEYEESPESFRDWAKKAAKILKNKGL